MTRFKKFDSFYFYRLSFGLYCSYLFLCHLIFFGELQISSIAIQSLGPLFVKGYFAFALLNTILFTLGRGGRGAQMTLLMTLMLYPTVFPPGNWIAFPALPISLAFFIFLHFLEGRDSAPRNAELAESFFCLSLGTMYLMSGLDKVSSPFWISGEAISLLYKNHNQLFRESGLISFLFMAKPLTSIMTWGVCLVETSGILLVLQKCRFVVLLSLLSLHIGMAIFLKLFELGMPFFIVLIWLIFRRYEQTRVSDVT